MWLLFITALTVMVFCFYFVHRLLILKVYPIRHAHTHTYTQGRIKLISLPSHVLPVTSSAFSQSASRNWQKAVTWLCLCAGIWPLLSLHHFVCFSCFLLLFSLRALIEPLGDFRFLGKNEEIIIKTLEF